ncbi:MAG: carboxypeptidase regulatory-like domain-containing protein, partial [Thermoplasmata archaeon]
MAWAGVLAWVSGLDRGLDSCIFPWMINSRLFRIYSILFIGILLFCSVCSINIHSEMPEKITIAGIITDGERPIQGAFVEIEEENGNQFQNFTNENGEFSFIVYRGLYTLYVSKDGYVQAKVKNIDAYENITNISLELSLSAIITGKVTCEGVPLEGITVHAISDYFDSSDVTDNEGFYNISRDVPCGNVTLFIEEAGYVKYEYRTNVSEGVIYHIDISLTGTPVEGASVTLQALGMYFSTLTNLSGFFFFSGLDDGEYNLTVRKDGFSKYYGTVWLPSNQFVEITLDHFLELYSPINGSVTPNEKIKFIGRTERGSTLILENKNYISETISDMDGNFSLEIELFEGENNISLTSINENYSERIVLCVYRIPPLSVVINNPIANSTLNATTVIRGLVNGSKTHSLPKVEIFIDGEYKQTNESWSFEFLWNLDERDNGRHLISVHVLDLRTGYISYSNISVEVHISYHREVLVIPPKGKSSKPGDVLTFNFTVLNLGEKIDSFRLITESRSGWLCDAEVSTLILQAGEVKNVSVLLAIPSNVQNGWKDELTLIAVSSLDAEVENAAKVSTIVISENFEIIPSHTVPYVFAFVLLILTAIFAFYLGKKSKENEMK